MALSPTDPAGAERQQTRLLGLSLTISGVLTIAVAVFLGATVDSVLYAIALVGLVDFGFAWAYGSGRIGPAARRRREAEQTGDAAQIAAADPGYNPYARED